jgi:hypothetical protein
VPAALADALARVREQAEQHADVGGQQGGPDELAALNHAIAHELGEWFLRCRGYVEADVEELSGRVAAAICVTRAAFVSAHGNDDDDLSGLSKSFRVSEA